MIRISRITALLAGVVASAVIAAPAANAVPPPCNTVGQTAIQQAMAYLDRHPDVRATVTSNAARDGLDVVEFLNRHPDVRHTLVDGANTCLP
jgi:hypothetical protein